MLQPPTSYTVPEILGLISGRRSLPTSSSQLSELTFQIDGQYLPPNSQILLLKGSLQSLMALSSTALLGAPPCFPVSSFVHTFDTEFFGANFQPQITVAPRNENKARIGAFLAIAELFTYLNEGRSAGPSPTAAHYTRTFSYALSRSKLLWPAGNSLMLFERWMSTRELTGWSANGLLAPSKVLDISDFWTGRRDGHEWAYSLLSENIEAHDGTDEDTTSRAARLISQHFSLPLPPLPFSFDARFEWLTNAVRQIETAAPSDKDIEFSVGLLLGSIEPGELMHLNWLRSLLSKYPGVAMQYAAWSAELSTKKDDRADVFNGLVRRITRELNRPFRSDEAPTEDLSWIDLASTGEIADEARLRASGKSLLISLVPGVTIGASLNTPSHDIAAQLAIGRPKKSAQNQVTRSKTEIPKQPVLFSEPESGEASLENILKEIGALKELLTTKLTTTPKATRRKTL